MRISMARCTGLERESNPLGLLIRTFDVAFRAFDFGMLAGQRILRLRMVEVGDDLPVPGGMALLALLPEPSLMLIGMTSRALARYPEEGAIEVFDANGQFVSNGDMTWVVTFVAGERGVFAFEDPSGFRVIELLQRRLPFDQLKIFAVMLRVTRAAFLAATSLFHDSSMVSMARANPGCDLGVAIEALEGSFTDAEFVTRGAITSSGERGVRARQGSGRDLCR